MLLRVSHPKDVSLAYALIGLHYWPIALHRSSTFPLWAINDLFTVTILWLFSTLLFLTHDAHCLFSVHHSAFTTLPYFLKKSIIII